jgi:hypothetical protein
MLADRKALLQSSRHPLIFTPGDNDWTDCHTGTPAVDPAGAAEGHSGASFYGEARTLGQKTFPVKRQGGGTAHGKYVENRRLGARRQSSSSRCTWSAATTTWGAPPESDAEHAERNAANIAWMKQAFEAAEQGKHKAVVIFTQANPYFEDRWPAGRRSLNRIDGPAVRNLPDSAPSWSPSSSRSRRSSARCSSCTATRTTFRVDKPLFDTASGRILENLTRVESFGSPYVHWVRIVVDTEKPGHLRVQARAGGGLMNDVSPSSRTAARMAHIEPFEVMEIQSLARQVEAQGGDVIHMEIGEPDFRTPQPVVDAAKKALDDHRMYYTSALGLPALREAISGFYRTRYGVDGPGAAHHRDRGLERALLPRLRRAAERGRRGAARRSPATRATATSSARWAPCRAPSPWDRSPPYQLNEKIARAHWGERTRMIMVASPANPHRHAGRARGGGAPRQARAREERHAAGGRDLPRPHLRHRRAHRRECGDDVFVGQQLLRSTSR